jgi:hypothetical protein
MPYLNTSANTFGHSVLDARIANPNASIPDGHSYGDFEWYEPTAPEFDPTTHTAVEVPPLNGTQQWGVVPLPVIAPAVCTAAQGERALFDLRSITDTDVLTAISLIQDENDRYRARSAYQRATEWRRDSETTQTLAAILALSEADLDALFTYAVTVNV